jgi:AraC-like DNA-binding protein
MGKNEEWGQGAPFKAGILFIDRTRFGPDEQLIRQVREAGCSTGIVQRGQYCTEATIGKGHCHCACFLFDYPVSTDLGEICELKQRYPQVPVLLVTLTHSEEFAIWAFRSGVYDFFPHPVDKGRFLSVVATLRGFRQAGQTERRAVRRLASPLPAESRVTTTATMTRRLQTAISYLERHYADKIMQRSVAEACDMSTFQFSRAFHKIFGVTFQEYLVRLRLEKASAFLRNPEVSVIDVAFATGFNDPSYFSRAFKRFFGVLPSEYKLKHQQMACDSGKRPDTIPYHLAESQESINA